MPERKDTTVVDGRGRWTWHDTVLVVVLAACVLRLGMLLLRGVP